MPCCAVNVYAYLCSSSLPSIGVVLYRIHRAGLYLNGDGVVVSKALPQGGVTSVQVERLTKVLPEPTEEKDDTDEGGGEEDEEVAKEVPAEPVKFVSEMVAGKSRCVRHGVWNIISVAVKPSAGETRVL